MLDHLQHLDASASYHLRSSAACSTALRIALRTQHGGFYTVSRTHAPPATSGRHPFAPRHIPQFLPIQLYERHLAGLDGISSKLLRRAACFKLFELADGGTWMDAAGFFQIPVTTARSTLACARRWTRPNLNTFENAVQYIAQDLEARAVLIDFQARRQALARWSIPEADWQTLASDLTTATRPGRPATYDDHKRRVASVIVWAQLTQTEHLFAPLVVAEKDQHGRSGLRAAVTAIVCRSTPRNADLRAALTAYEERLALAIDSPAIPETAP
jgi:hypothetical protein